MSLTSVVPSTSRRAAGLAAGLAALVLQLAACGNDEVSSTPTPTDISIAPPTSAAPPTSDTPSSADPAPSESPTAAATSKRPSASAGLDALGAVKAAETGVADSTVVELSKDDDSGSAWEAAVRVGDGGRELRIDSGGEITSNQAESLSSVQRGNPPDVSVSEAIRAAQKRVPDGEVTDAELTRENQRTVWDVSVEVAGGDDWELWIDASSGEVIREERD
ncbi:MAG TPA: PepSY domain-containing protein [Microlunatus sp.]